MYEAYFGFTERPFAAIPRSDRYFPAVAVESARQSLIRCIERSEGCGLIVGPAGTGKSLLCQVVADHFQPRLDVVLLSSIHLGSSKEMLQAIAYELGLPYKRLDEGELRLSLIDRISPREKSSDGMLLVVDEAHALSPKVLEELRLLTNLVRGGTPRVRLVLAGAPVLDERFASPRLASFNQRLAVRCYLEPFSAEETHEYVRAHTAVAGADPDGLWTGDALRAIHHATDGCPRLINQLCDLTLMLAAKASASQVDAAAVNEAWAELQQLPMPWNVDTRGTQAPADDEAAAASAVVEFGSLDDEPASQGEAVQQETLDSEATNSAVSESDAVEREDPEILEPEIFDPLAGESDDGESVAEGPQVGEPEEPVAGEPVAEEQETGEPASMAAAGDAPSERLAYTDDAASDVPIEVPADPTSQVDRIEAHLASFDQSVVRDDYDLPRLAENARCQVELVFDETAPARATAPPGDSEAGYGDDRDEPDEESAIDQPVIVKDFVGLEGDTVLRLSPGPRTVSADDEDDDPAAKGSADTMDEAIRDKPVLEIDRPKESWLSGLARVMQQQANSDLKPFDEPAPEVQAAADATQALDLSGRAAAPQPVEANFVELQYVDETAEVIENDRHDPVTPMPSIVVEYTADHPAGDDAVGDDPVGDDPVGDGRCGDDPAGDDPVGDDPVGDGRCGDDRREQASAAAEVRPSDQGHPTIPVRQREYRQLFAKLRQREMQDNR